MACKLDKKVMVFGTFDIFHKGHKSFLKQAKQYGDYLIVVIARDKTVLKVKGKVPLNKEYDRLQIAKKSNLADELILGDLKDKYKVIEKYKPDIICLGYDQITFTKKLDKILKKINLDKIKIIRLKSYKSDKYKSSKFRIILNRK